MDGFGGKSLYASTFYVTYVLLITTATITFIEALRTTSTTVRHVMNLETCISVVAAYFYGVFIQQIARAAPPADINRMRYLDWSITTPMMLLSLMLVMANGRAVPLVAYIGVLVLNYTMLALGYAGEGADGRKKRWMGAAGFVAFALMYALIWKALGSRGGYAATVVFALFVVLWGFYGVVYYLPEKEKNVGYNVLDAFAKCLTGLGLWAYFTHVVG
jgi:bacteriorhodopsin